MYEEAKCKPTAVAKTDINITDIRALSLDVSKSCRQPVCTFGTNLKMCLCPSEMIIFLVVLFGLYFLLAPMLEMHIFSRCYT